MELKYKGKDKLVFFPDRNLWVTDGLVVTSDDKETQKVFKELGFKEVKENKKDGE